MGIQRPTSYYRLSNRGRAVDVARTARFHMLAVSSRSQAPMREESLRQIRLIICLCALSMLVSSILPAQQPQQSTPPAEALPPSTLDSLAKYQGLIVTKIELRSAVSMHPNVLKRALVQKEGQPFDKEKVRQTLEALFATGRFADLEVQG